MSIFAARSTNNRYPLGRLSTVQSLISIAERFQFRPIRLSIAWRLGLSFVAVAILAATANFMVADGESLITRTNEALIPPSIEAPVEAPPPVTKPTATAAPTGRSLEIAVDRFESAVLARAQSNTRDTNEQLQAMQASLRRAASHFSQGSDARSAVKPTIDKAIATTSTSAKSLIAAADSRKATHAAYATQFEAVNEHLKQSMDRAWKIFGRIVARQVLVELTNELDAIRRNFVAWTTIGDASAIEALLASEQALLQTLSDNERSLKRSQGEAWTQTMQEGVSRILAARRAIEDAESRWQRARRQFATATANARETVRQVEGAPAPAAAVVQPAAANAAVPVAIATATRPDSVEVAAPDARPLRYLLGALTAAVLSILLAISVSTVLSIVRPVRRMLRATEQLAHGSIEPLQGGGIKELDTLALAFNRMAAEVTATRARMSEHHAELENRVEQRTRQLQVLAEQDPLTLLPNRRQFSVSLEAALTEAKQTGSAMGVYFLDLDNFKNINDSMGHEFGDRVIMAVADRLRTLTADIGFAARLGGDEFTIVATRVAQPEDVRAIGERIVAAFEEPLWIDRRELMVSVSVGASMYPDHETTPASLLRAADVALFHAKELGRTQLAMFSPHLLQAAATKFDIEQGLRRAIDRGEFELVFQPELSVERLTVDLVEALIRWRTPDGRLANPAEFLAVAEESGLIIEIGEWVLRTAVATAARWHYGAWPDVRIAVNVSARQLQGSGFVDHLDRLLSEFKLPSRCIELELTESVLQTSRHVADTLRGLRSRGVGIALDDFGTGYSSLSSLEQLPLTRIKLDRSLIDRIDSNERSAAIAHAIVSMCRGLGLAVTAEGIERREQFDLLLEHRAMYLQGYLISRPVPESDLLAELGASTQRARLLADRHAEGLLHRESASGGAPARTLRT